MLPLFMVALLLAPLFADAQSYPSPTYQNVTVIGTLTAATPSFTNPVPVASGGTNCAAASGTCLDNITGFASTGFLTRTGAGAYAFQSLTNGITYGNLAQAGANTLLGNATGSTANVAAVAVTGCNGSAQALQWTSGSGFGCNSSIATSGANANITSLSGLTTALSVSQGGTGRATLTSHAVLVGAGTTAVTQVAPSTAGQALVSAGASSDPVWGLPTGTLIGVQVFTSSGTYTPTTGTASVIVEVQAPGGGGGGVSATGAGQVAQAQSGSGGSYAKARVTSGFSGVTVTIGAAGTGGSAGTNAGTSGGTTSFGSIISCPGGVGGAGSAAVTPPQGQTGAAAPSACTITGATTLVSIPGGAGALGISQSTNFVVAAAGGVAVMGLGSSNGSGSGGNGASVTQSTAATAGSNGAVGRVIVYEYD
jgi:hypothetical protein